MLSVNHTWQMLGVKIRVIPLYSESKEVDREELMLQFTSYRVRVRSSAGTWMFVDFQKTQARVIQ